MERSTIFHGKIHYFYGHFPLLSTSDAPDQVVVTPLQQRTTGRRRFSAPAKGFPNLNAGWEGSKRWMSQNGRVLWMEEILHQVIGLIGGLSHYL